MAEQFAFREQIAFLLGKTNVPTRDWTGVWRDEHDVAFMVAGAYKAELLGDMRNAVNKAITENRSLDSFRAEFDEIVARHGWSYNGSRGWRTRVIFETNMRTSYQAGRYAQLTEPAFLKANPLWRYKHSEMVTHPRPEHQAWDGLVLDAGDPWWKAHYPPNGWGCKCTVYAESARSAARRGYKVGTAPPVEMVEREVGTRGPNPRTVSVPKGIDPGWDYAPGARRAEQVRNQVEQTAAGLPRQLQLDLRASIDAIPKPPPVPKPMPPLKTPRDYASAGKGVVESLGIDLRHPDALSDLKVALHQHRGTSAAVAMKGSGVAVDLVEAASRMLPDDWTSASDAFGKFLVSTLPPTGRSVYSASKNRLDLRSNAGQHIALHELVHRLQHVMPELDAVFQQLHRERTAGDPLKMIGNVLGQGTHGAGAELVREDHYAHPYQGREYNFSNANGPALEVMTMAFQHAWGGDQREFARLIDKDPEMLQLVVGLLWYFTP